VPKNLDHLAQGSKIAEPEVRVAIDGERTDPAREIRAAGRVVLSGVQRHIDIGRQIPKEGFLVLMETGVRVYEYG